MDQVSWIRTERSLVKNCINWVGRNQRGRRRKNSGYLTSDLQRADELPPGRAYVLRDEQGKLISWLFLRDDGVSAEALPVDRGWVNSTRGTWSENGTHLVIDFNTFGSHIDAVTSGNRIVGNSTRRSNSR